MKIFLSIAAVALLVVGSSAQTRSTSLGASLPRFEVDPSFPQLPAGKVLGDMSSVSVDARDHVWMIHRPRTVAAEQRANAMPPVLEFDASGKYLAGWGGPAAAYEWPEREHGVYADPTGAIWISGNNGYGTPPPPGSSDDMLLKFTPAGKFLLQIGHSGKSTGDADKQNVKQAADMTLFGSELYVADGYGNHRVVVFDAKNGAFKRTWGANGGTPFNIAHAVRVSNDGLVYLADRENKRVQVFTAAGEFKQQVVIGGDGVTRSAAGLAFSPDRAQQYLYVADINNQIHILDRLSLKVLASFGKGGTAPGEFGTVHEIATDSKGNIYTAELRTHRVQKFVVK